MNKTLSTDMELFAAALSQATVAVIQHTADDIPVFIASGVIEKYTTHSVKIGATSYLRDESEFRIDERSSRLS
ncbi:hypothetical protein HQN89_00245 [Paenibacillus frigoriresistens]|uniref:hypothetical protein n=1 Tax=Paenibacillus alginolyticus TaxID=59839 RepID=UPI00156366A2|nr:hypothetical protein [Paenibacillus frigoriresistens]NRF89468.1 hypothetical protein [Paenibacillus frigoriresistens]